MVDPQRSSLLAAPAIVASARLDRDPLKTDFRNFQHKVWMTLFGNPPSDLMYEMAHRLQHGPRRDIIMGWRGLSKSFTTVAFAIWTLYCDPTEIVLATSGNDKGAKGNADLAWGWVNTFEWMAHMKPSGMLRQSSQAFDVQGSRMEKSESFAAMSLFGQITGRRASLIIPDDVETPNTSETQGDRDRMRLRYAELGGSILKTGGKIKVLGTAQHEQTLYLELVTDKGYSMMMWPVYYPHISIDPKLDELRKYGPWLAPSILKAVRENPELAHTTVDPVRFPEDELQERRLEYGQVEFDRQFRLFMDAGQGVSTFLKLRDIPIIDLTPPSSESRVVKVPGEYTWNPSPSNLRTDLDASLDSLGGDSHMYAPDDVGLWQEPEFKLLIVDPSGDGADECTWEVLCGLLGRVGLVDLGASTEGFSESTLEAIAEMAAKWGVHEIEIEKNYGGGMFGALLRPKLTTPELKKKYPGWNGCTITETTAGGQSKEVRIVDTLTPAVTDHRLWVAADVIPRDFSLSASYDHVADNLKRTYRLTYQLTRMTKKKGCVAHDDRVDALASGVARFTDALKRHVKEAAQEAKDRALQEEAEKMRAYQDKLMNRGEGVRGELLVGFTRIALTDSPLFAGRASPSRAVRAVAK